MKRIAVPALLGLLVVMSGCKPWGQDQRYAVLNIQAVVTKSNIGIRAMQDLKAKFEARRLDLKQREGAIKQLEAVLRVDPSLEKRSQLQQLLREYAIANQQLLKEEASEKLTIFKPVVDKINATVAAYAKEKGYVGIQDMKGFAYADPSLDVTEDVLKRLNSGS